MMLVAFSSINFLEAEVSVSILSFLTADEANANGEMAIWNNPTIVNIHTITMKELWIQIILLLFRKANDEKMGSYFYQKDLLRDEELRR